MSKVSNKTHSQPQLNNYANQKNPNNSAYRANQNKSVQSQAVLHNNNEYYPHKLI